MKITSILIFLATFIGLSAQFKGSEWSIYIQPTLGNRFVQYKNEVSQKYKDSIAQADGYRKSIGAGLEYHKVIDRYSSLQFGLQYFNAGFTRTRKAYKFLDTIHPQIGIMADLSDPSGNYVKFNYRFHFVALPVLYQTKLKIKRLPENTSLFWLGGAQIDMLIKHDIKAKLYGFSAYGEKEFVLDNKEADASRYNLALQTGLRFEYMLEDHYSVYVQPQFILPILVSNFAKERYFLYAFNLNIGMHFRPANKDKSGKKNTTKEAEQE